MRKDRILWCVVALILLCGMGALSVCDAYLMDRRMSAADQTDQEEKNNGQTEDTTDAVDDYLKNGDACILLAIGAEGALPNGGNAPIYAEMDTESEVLANLQYNCAILVRTEYLETGKVYRWIPVDFPNTGQVGYVLRDQIDLQSLNVQSPTDSDVRNEMIGNAISYIGLRFVRYGKSLQSGIDCSNFIQQIYAGAGEEIPNTPNDIRDAGEKIENQDEALPGDIVYYDVNNGEGHVGMYLGDGLMINSAGHDGMTYPEGGVRICRLYYHDRENCEFYRLIR